MQIILSNIKSIFKNLSFKPQKALINSYPLVNSNEVSGALIAVLAIIFGISNAITQKFLPISIVNSIDKSSSKFLGVRLGSQFSHSYSPNILKYLLIGIILFIIILLTAAVISYAVKTSLFKEKGDFLLILRTTSVFLIPGTLFLFISSIFAILSIFLYLVFLAAAISLFIIYFYQHLCNINAKLYDKACFIASISFIVLVFVTLKLNVNTEISGAILNVIENLFSGITSL